MRSGILQRIRQVALVYSATLLVLAGASACNSGSGVVTISGAGSTFVYPVMTRWIEDYAKAHPDVHINYQSIGSGGGIQQARTGTVDFGATDTPLSNKERAEMPPMIEIPESAGPVCITYNLAGVQMPLRLSGSTLAGIYLGEIRNWRDARIAADNPGVKLPDEEITVVHRADGSGTTAAFTGYLAAISPEWKQKAGVGKSVSWPLGLGGKGSEGVTGQVKQSPGAIGYVELTYAAENHLPVAAIGNQAGNYITPSTASATAAIAAFDAQLAADSRTPIVNPPASAANAYPISTLTYLLVPKDGRNPRKRAALKQFLLYVMTRGQETAGGMQYAPLPEAIRRQNVQALSGMLVRGQPIP